MFSFYKKSIPHQNIILTALFVLFLVGSLGVSFWLMIRSIKNFGQSFQNIANKIAAHEEDREQARHADALVKKRETDIKKVKEFFIDRKEPVLFIEQLEEIARTTRNKVALTIDEEKGETNSLMFRVSVQGSEATVRMMLTLIELMPYQIAVEDIIFEKREDVEVLAKGGGAGGNAPSTLLVLLRVQSL